MAMSDAEYASWYASLAPSSRALAHAPGSPGYINANKGAADSFAAFGGVDPFDYALGAGAKPATNSQPLAPTFSVNTPPAVPGTLNLSGAASKVGFPVQNYAMSGAPGGFPAPTPGATVAPTPGGSAWSAFNPWGGTGQAGNENRSISYQGLDPRLDQFFGFGLNEAMRNYMTQAGQQFYGGPTVAGLTPDELKAQEYLRGMAGSAGATGSSGMGFLDSLLANGMNPGVNPQVDAAVAATMRDVTRQATDPGGVFSQIRGNSLANGAYGGSRQGVLESLALGRLADSLGKTSADMRLSARGQDINAANQGIGNQANFASLATLPASLLGGVGAQNRGMDQAFMNDALTRWLYNTNQPNVALQNLFNSGNASPLGGWGAGSSWLSDAALNSGGTSNTQNVVGGVAAGAGIWNILRDAGII